MQLHSNAVDFSLCSKYTHADMGTYILIIMKEEKKFET